MKSIPDKKIIDSVIQFYDTELNNYKAKVNPGMSRLLDEERTPYLKQLNALYDIYMFQNYLLDYQAEFFNQPGNQTLSLFFSKVSGDIFSLRQCLMVGQLVSASSIERNIFETYVDTKLVLEKDTGERSLLFEEYKHILLWGRVKTYQKYLEELDKDGTTTEEKKDSVKEHFESLFKKDDLETLEKNYHKVKENYHPKNPRHWAWIIFKDEIKGQNNPTLAFICKKLRIYEDYLSIYSTSSLAVHNHPLIANIMTRQGGITSVPIFSETTNSIAGISANLVIEIIVMILEYAKSTKYEEIELFLNHFYKKNFID